MIVIRKHIQYACKGKIFFISLLAVLRVVQNVSTAHARAHNFSLTFIHFSTILRAVGYEFFHNLFYRKRILVASMRALSEKELRHRLSHMHLCRI
jgi:hypothetical protein